MSLLPAATEMIAALGAWSRLVGVTHACDYPGAARALPPVTASAIDDTASAGSIDAAVRDAVAQGSPMFALDEARIRLLEPSIIVTQGLCDVCAVAEGEVRRLAASLRHPAQVVSLTASTLEEVVSSIDVLAHALGTEDEGEEVRFGLHARLRLIHDTLRAARAPRPRVAVIEWTDPLYIAGHWVPDMVRRAGGIDVLAHTREHSRERPIDDLREAAPELLVFAPCGYPLARAIVEAKATLMRPAWQWAAGLRLAVMDGNALTSRPGPRLVDGVEVMARLFNPSLFSPIAAGRGTTLSLG